MGCPRDASACHFAHPHERGWKAAHSSLPPKRELVADSDSEFYYSLVQSDRSRDHRDRDRDRERDRDRDRDREDRAREKKRGRDTQKNSSSSLLGSPPRRRDSTTTHASPGPPSRRSTFDDAMDGSGATKRGTPRSPALSTFSDQLERLAKDSKHRTNDPLLRDHIPSASRRSRSRSRDRGRDRERVGLPSKVPPSGSHLPDTRNANVLITPHPSTLPPEPPKSPPMLPPPPPPQVPEVPKVPSFVSNQQTASLGETGSKKLKELSVDEQRSAWHERIEYAHIILHLVH